MRALPLVLAFAVVALAGCSSSEPSSPVDPESVDADDYEVPLFLLGIAIIVGVVLLAVNLSRQGGSRPPAPPPPQPPTQAPPQQPTWEPVPPAAPKSLAPKTPRRRAP